MPAQHTSNGFLGPGVIANRVAELGDEVTAYYRALEGPLVVVGLLKGGFIFMADLVRQIKRPHTMNFIIAQSYGKGKTPENMDDMCGWVKLCYIPNGLRDQHVLLVDDIVDSGVTLTRVSQALEDQQPRSLEICVLLNRKTPKTANRDLPNPRFIGFNLTHPGFVAGYGLDYDEHLRQLPYIMRTSE